MPSEKKQLTPSEREEEILAFWRAKKVFEKSLSQRKKREQFTFYDGPPFATGLPHYGHIVASVIKDVIPRYQTMKGRYVPRKWGWDCHGLPLENLVEQELGLKTKKDIEKYGIAKFNRYAAQSVLRYADEWKKVIPRIGRWVDMKDDYKTMDWSYSETIWWIFKTLHEKNLIYEGYKSMHICPRCETTLANFEVTLGYKEIKDNSVYVKFELEDQPGTYVLAWTTTPWTLPGNVALAVRDDIDYVMVRVEVDMPQFGLKKDNKIIFADNIDTRIRIFGNDQTTKKLSYPSQFAASIEDPYRKIKSEYLIGKKYKPLFNYYSHDKKLENHENGWKIYPADFVTTDEGTGVVHIAPAFGEEDMELGKKFKLPFVQHVTMQGTFKPEVKDFAGLPVKPKGNHQVTDKKIIVLLREKKLLFAEQEITHSYPLCWRCDTPLLNYAASSWFVNVTTVKEKLVANNKDITWVPAHIRDGRFGKWLEGSRDWAISRSRFWGAPLPVWTCSQCETREIIGSLDELDKCQGNARNEYIVMRHGEALSNRKNVVSYHKGKYPLTLKGRSQAEQAGKALKKKGIDLIYASPILRASQTAEVVANVLGIKKSDIHFDERLEEINVGVFDGKPIREYRESFNALIERFTRRPKGGEILPEVRERMLSVIQDLEKKHKGKRILIISHEHAIWMLWDAVLGMKEEEAIKIREQKGGDGFIQLAEIMELPYRRLPFDETGALNMHRPYIDDIEFPCRCGGVMKRIPDVFDCWFESGSMPYGQFHYPFENKKIVDAAKDVGFPADFIAEGLDQTRGWFYSLLVLSTALFKRSAYKSVIVNGTILAEDGQKMSKRLKNYPDPMEVVGKYGADAVRLYLLDSPAMYGEDLNFSVKGVEEIYKKYVLISLNVLNFLKLYEYKLKGAYMSGSSKHVLDRWILSRLQTANQDVSASLESYELHRAVRTLSDFLQDLSLWYVRRSRERTKGDGTDAHAALSTLCRVLTEFAKMTAPVTPFLAETLYQELPKSPFKKAISVHLEDWPEFNAKFASMTLEKDMETVRSIVSQALKLRAEAGIRVRQPLAECQIPNLELKKKPELLALIQNELNVKKILFGRELKLDTVITSTLREEGIAREFVRNTQELRRDAGFKPGQAIRCNIAGDETLVALLQRWGKTIKKDIGAKAFTAGGKNEGKAKKELKLDGKTVIIAISK